MKAHSNRKDINDKVVELGIGEKMNLNGRGIYFLGSRKIVDLRDKGVFLAWPIRYGKAERYL